MYDTLCMTVINRHEKTAHVFGGLGFGERLICSVGDLGEQLDTWDVLHHEVDVFVVIVGLVVLDDVRVIKRIQDRDLLHDQIHVIPQFLLV